MTREDDAFLKRLLATFRIEAEEHLKAMSQLLLTLEQAAPHETLTATVEALFREAHSLKGAARSVDRVEIDGICRALESAFAQLKQQQISPSPAFFDALFRALDQLGLYLAADGPTQAAWNPASLIEQIDALTGPHPAAAQAERRTEARLTQPEPMHEPTATQQNRLNPQSTGAEPSPHDTVRISTAKLGALLTQVEELLAFKFNASHRVNELRMVRTNVSNWKRIQDHTARERRLKRAGRSRDAIETIDPSDAFTPTPRAETSESHAGFAKTLVDQLSRIEHETIQERRALSGMLDNLLDEMKQALMLPVATLFEWIPKLVRDLARDSDKEVVLELSRGSMEIDRRILEQLKTPLIHLIRNAVDHGIETPAARRQQHKPAQGLITIEVVPLDGNKIELRISDDGAGPKLEKIKAQALKLGRLTAEALARFSDSEVMSLMFESGLTTSAILSDVSGRGLGLAIVREKIEKIGGSIAVQRGHPDGICFRLTVPTTLANFHGVLVAVGEHHFVLPSLNVDAVDRVAASQVKTVENRDTIEFNGHILPLVNLARVLQLSHAPAFDTASDLLPIVVVVSGGKRVAFSVDAVLGDHEVLVRGLGPQLLRVPNITGATLMGAGRVVPILNPSDLLKSALGLAPLPRRDTAAPALRRRAILVVEDSITSRALIKNILESAGYLVSGAFDGIDALTALRTGQFDLVVSDVEMPRMDGFSLTSAIRADRKFSELPVILVTALDSRDHKERGIEVGANAYLVKSSFDQSNLLDAVKRLI
jgi:two-component system chemotaxis sensor kinase CheA